MFVELKAGVGDELGAGTTGDVLLLACESHKLKNYSLCTFFKARLTYENELECGGGVYAPRWN